MVLLLLGDKQTALPRPLRRKKERNVALGFATQRCVQNLNATLVGRQAGVTWHKIDNGLFLQMGMKCRTVARITLSQGWQQLTIVGIFVYHVDRHYKNEEGSYDTNLCDITLWLST